MGVDEKLVREIVERVLRVARPVRIVLFGSAAAGTMTADSDIDLLVVAKEPVDAHAESLRIGRALRGLGCPFDVIVISLKRFEQTRDVVGGIAYPADKHGKTIHAA
jgi:predicted nucleotidyltransferase